MKSEKRKRRWITITLLVFTGALAIYVLMELDKEQVKSALAAMKPFWIFMLVGCMFLYYLFDSLKYMIVTNSFGCKQSFYDSMTTTMLGFFYSAVTPLASGGQPFQIYHMHKKGMSVGTSTSIICMVYVYWKIALVTMGLLGFFIYRKILLDNGPAWVPFLMIGWLLQALALSAVIFSVILPNWVTFIGSSILKFFFSFDVFSSRGITADRSIEKWTNFVNEYHTAFVDGTKDKKLVAYALGCAFLELIAYMSVAYCSYRGFGMRGQPYYRIMFLQVLLYLGASLVPTPGAAGASEGGYMAVYKDLFGPHITMSMLIWRLATYYLTLLVGYGFVVAERMAPRRQARKDEKQSVIPENASVDVEPDVSPGESTESG